MAIIKQFVNLRRDDRDENGVTTNYVGTEDIKDIKQVEYRLFECAFKKAKLAMFKVRVKATKGNSGDYAANEKNRNENFKLRIVGSSASTGKKTKLSQQVYLPAAGGCQYKLEAKYGRKTIESKKTIETWRRIYYQIFSMKGVPIAPLNQFQDAFKKYFIDMLEMFPAEGKDKLILRETLYDSDDSGGQSNENAVIADAKKYYKIGKYQPNAVAAIFVKKIATYEEIVVKTQIKSIPSYWDALWGPSETVFEVVLKDRYRSDAYLWKDLASEKDAGNYWLLSWSMVTSSGKKLPLRKNAVTIDESLYCKKRGGRKYGFSKLKVTVHKSDIGHWFKTEKVFIKLKVRVVKGFSGGYSKNSKNVIFIATRVWWNTKDYSASKLSYILNHEMGHKLGMVAAGDSPPAGAGFFAWINPKAPNRPPNIYGQYYNGPLANNKGHQGPHCEKNATYNATTNVWTGLPGCVMFGSTGNETGASPPDFCADCGKVVAKLDLQGSAIPGLKNRFF